MTTLGSFFNLDFSVSSYCNPAEPARGATGGDYTLRVEGRIDISAHPNN